MALNQWSEDGAGGYTMLIRPSGAARTITGTGSSATLIKLNGADRVTIDGSLSGGTDRSLTIVNPYASSAASVIWVASTTGPNGATNNTVKNCSVVGASPTTTLGAIVSSGSSLGALAETANSNNTFQNNAIAAAQYGITLVGPTGNETGNSIVDNVIGSTVAASKIGFNGIAVFQQANATVASNSIAGVNTATTSTASGIRVSGTASGISITANQIADVKNTNTGGWGANGIQLNSSTTAANVTVSNNFISDVAAYGYASGAGVSDNGYGIIAVTGGGYNIYFNTVSLTTDQTVAGIPAAINVTSGIATAGSIDLRNNILSNQETVGTRYAIYSGAAATVYANINYNVYYAQNVGYLGTAQATLAAWQAATGQDANSISTDPLLISATDLHLQATSPAIGAGTPIAGITTDIDGDSRSATNPSSGADEGPAVVPVTFIYNDLEDAVGSTDNLYVDGLLGFGNPQVMAADGGAEVFSVTLSLTRNLPLSYKYVVNTFDGYGYDLLNNPNINRVITITAASTINDYRRISQYDYYALLSPANATVWLGNPSPSVLGELYINNLTAAAGALPGLRAQVGFGQSTDPSTWTWVEAPHTGQAGNNDQYAGVFTPTLTGVYSYAVRFNANWGATNPNNAWKYGGLGFAPLANDLSNAGVLTVTVPPVYPSIVVTKTVGLPGAGCTGGKSLTVGLGAAVEYCYTVENTGNVTFTTHTVTDTLLGTLLSGYAYVLNPGDSVAITGTYTHNVAGLIPNTVTWEATDGVDTAFASDSASVFVVSPAVVLTKTVSAGACASATDPLTVTVGAGCQLLLHGTKHRELHPRQPHAH